MAQANFRLSDTTRTAYAQLAADVQVACARTSPDKVTADMLHAAMVEVSRKHLSETLAVVHRIKATGK